MAKQVNALVVAAMAAVSASALVAPWMDPSQPVATRVEALLANMTIQDKLWQLRRPDWDNALPSTGVGLLEFSAVFATAPSGVANATAVAAQRNAIQRAFLSDGPGARLGIPAAFRLLTIHGCEAFGTTFPEGPGLGASWDTQLVQKVGQAIAAEGRAIGADMYLPVINLWSDARFGRQEEGFSEEPTLTSAYAAALVAGSQGSLAVGPWDYFNDTVNTIPVLFKHVGAYGVAAGGMNGGRADVPEHTVREVYLKPWRRAAASGARGVMPSHNSVLHTPAHGSTWLLRGRLRGDFNWTTGLFVSDTGDVQALGQYRLCGSDAACAALALNAGVDIEQVPGQTFMSLPQAIAANLTSQAIVDDAVRRVLSHKFSTRLFDQPYVNESLAATVINSAEHRQLALQAAQEGSVLLVNHNNTLPLAKGSLKVAVVGPNGGCGNSQGQQHRDGQATRGSEDYPTAAPLCDAQWNMFGNYQESYAPPTGVQTVYDAVSASGYAASVTFNRGCDINDNNTSLVPAAVASAQAADVTIAVLGDSTNTCGEGQDRDNLDLPGGQLVLLQALEQALAGTGKRLVVVLIHCRTATFNAADGNSLLSGIDALMTAWRPGQMGGQAVSSILFGDFNPSGRLPMNWVRAVGQANGPASPWLQERVALWGGPASGAEGRTYGSYVQSPNPATPLFPFGYGLSYTTFQMSGLQVAVQVQAGSSSTHASGVQTSATGNLTYPLLVSLTVTNTGNLPGSTVVQVYVQDPVGNGLTIRPWKRLLGFARTAVLSPSRPVAGQTTTSSAGSTAGQAILGSTSASVAIPIRADDLGYYGDCPGHGPLGPDGTQPPTDCSTLRVWPGQYTVSVGFDSLTDNVPGQQTPVVIPAGAGYDVGLWA